ncbi:hypothetical protein D3C77_431710 [compost metagenome]
MNALQPILNRADTDRHDTAAGMFGRVLLQPSERLDPLVQVIDRIAFDNPAGLCPALAEGESCVLLPGTDLLH